MLIGITEIVNVIKLMMQLLLLCCELPICLDVCFCGPPFSLTL